MNTYTRTPYRSSYTPQKSVYTEKGPIQSEMSKYLREYQLSALFEEDTDTMTLLKHVPNTIAFRCILKKDGRVVGIGRGTSFLSKNNRYLDRAVSFTVHAALIDATVRAAKTMEAMDAGVPDISGSIASVQPYIAGDTISDKQKSYLETLIGNISDEDEREEWMNRLSVMTKDEASAAIATLKGL